MKVFLSLNTTAAAAVAAAVTPRCQGARPQRPHHFGTPIPMPIRVDLDQSYSASKRIWKRHLSSGSAGIPS